MPQKYSSALYRLWLDALLVLQSPKYHHYISFVFALNIISRPQQVSAPLYLISTSHSWIQIVLLGTYFVRFTSLKAWTKYSLFPMTRASRYLPGSGQWLDPPP